MLSLAQQLIIERARNPKYAGHLENPDLVGEGANPFCGDEIHLEISVDTDKKITDLKHTTRACSVCASSMDLLAEQWIGKTVEEAGSYSPEQVTELLGIPLSPVRLKCALLPVETLKQID